MMLIQRNGVYFGTKLARRGEMARVRDEHAEVSGKAGLGLFYPPAGYTKYLLHIQKLSLLISQKWHIGRAFVRVAIFVCFGGQSATSGFRPVNTLETKLGSRSYLIPTYVKTVMDFIGM